MTGSAGVGESSGNPVGVNLIPMVDILLCLCLFFMSSVHFKGLDAKIDAWLPRDG